MKLGDLVVVHFPYTNLLQSKVRPAVVVKSTDDRHRDYIVCLISSTLPTQLNNKEILLQPNNTNGLKVPSVIKVYRVATLEASLVISIIGRLSEEEIHSFVAAFQSLPLS